MRKIFGKEKVKQKKEKVVGDVRQSQLITTFGCGSIVDFLYDTVIIAGTDKWDWAGKSPDNKFIIYNENLQNLLGKEYFVKPRTDTRRRAMFADKSKDVPAYRFPEMLYCVKCLNLHHYTAFDHQTAKQMKCSICGNKSIIPSRFVAVCENGHIEDFPYSEWVHVGNKCPERGKPRLRLFNMKGRSGIENLFVKCESCGAVRGMQNAFAENALVNIKKCGANTPWLVKNHGLECSETLKTRLRTATNVYFPVTMSALSIPPWSQKTFLVLQKNYDAINDIFSLLKISPNQSPEFMSEIKDILLTKGTVQNIMQELPEVTIDEIIQCYDVLENNKGKGKKNQHNIYHDEYLALTKKDSNDEEYSAQFVAVPARYKSIITKVVAIDKLTEVVTMLGFTRVKSWSGKIDDEKIAPLSSKKQKWLPAVQMNGEGIFIEFDIAKLTKWSNSIGDYYVQMKRNLEQSFLLNERFSSEYIFLHTFAHLLIRQLSLECGYSAASLKEKIYSTFTGDENSPPMSGVLIYTAASDSDGSLGGLVEQSDPLKLGEIIDNMLETARWCSSDPLCITSFGKQGQGFESLNYAACHACALLPETSCEFRNLLLDRGALIGRPDRMEIGLFNAQEFEA
mgnify:CR=1 FL=1|jgi:ribosomal protein S27E